MNADETAVYEFLKGYPGMFVSVTEISRRLGARRKFDQDRTWARPILRRMELDGSVEANEVGEYRVKPKPNETTTFRKALSLPGAALGETTLISLDDVAAGER
jgi:hypothetical protein